MFDLTVFSNTDDVEDNFLQQVFEFCSSRIHTEAPQYHQLMSCGSRGVKEAITIILSEDAIDTKHTRGWKLPRYLANLFAHL